MTAMDLRTQLATGSLACVAGLVLWVTLACAAQPAAKTAPAAAPAAVQADQPAEGAEGEAKPAEGEAKPAESSGCKKDADCKGDRICEDGKCVSPK